MKKKLLINIDEDPRISHKPLEGLRIAASLITANIPVRVNISKYSDLLDNNKYEEVFDGLLFFQYLKLLKEYNCLEIKSTEIKKEENLVVLNF